METIQTENNKSYEDFRKEKDVLTDTSNNTLNSDNNIPTKYAGYGGFWRRVTAGILDMWPSIIIQFGIMSFILYKVLQSGDTSIINEMSIFYTAIMIILPIINIGINIYLYFKNGETLGYRLMGLKIISEKDGKKPSTKQLLSRFGIKAIFYYVPYINMVGIFVLGLWVAFSKTKQGPHDLVADTLVVRKDNKTGNILTWLIPLFSILLPILMGVLYVAISPPEARRHHSRWEQEKIQKQIELQKILDETDVDNKN